jgi:TonB family protein
MKKLASQVGQESDRRETRTRSSKRSQVSADGGKGFQALSRLKSSGYLLLDDRARITVQRWIFRPARRRGRPVATQADVPVRFRLNR